MYNRCSVPKTWYDAHKCRSKSYRFYRITIICAATLPSLKTCKSTAARQKTRWSCPDPMARDILLHTKETRASARLAGNPTLLDSSKEVRNSGSSSFKLSPVFVDPHPDDDSAEIDVLSMKHRSISRWWEGDQNPQKLVKEFPASFLKTHCGTNSPVHMNYGVPCQSL